MYGQDNNNNNNNNNNNHNHNNNNRIQRCYSSFLFVWFFFFFFWGGGVVFLQSPHSAANCLQHVRSSGPVTIRVQITCNTSSAYHVQVSCYVPLVTKGQLSY